MFGYYKEKATDKVKGYWHLDSKPEDTNEYKFFVCDEQNKPDIDIEPIISYDPEDLISWALQNLLSDVPDEHKGIAVGSLVGFANRANEKSKANFLSIANSVGLSDLAISAINKAIELGANITPIE